MAHITACVFQWTQAVFLCCVACYERALAIFEATLLPDHPKLLTTRANLAKLKKNANV